ncbi:unnamed protein product [Allacma fusca]|uniref:C2 domain-containing protein n=1 Tax=Allacma fusca TaxID=39272 RepID=A0A8J2PQC6_9HEXA|nr:unnamed protein product [Allacma fusca]
MLKSWSKLSFMSVNKVAAVNRPHRVVDDFVPGTAGNSTSTVEVSISCRHLANKDVLSKSDPMCAVFYKPPGAKTWVPFMRTEVVENDLDPDFAAKITMEYRFEAVQGLRFEVYDWDSDSNNLASQDSLGFIETNLAQIVTAGDEGLTLELTTTKSTFLPQDFNKPHEIIILTAEELASEKDEVTLKFSGSSCGIWNACIPPRTFFSISKLNDAGKYLLVYKSKFARGSNPNWQLLKMTSRALCNGDHDRALKIEIYQRNLQGESASIGSVLTTLSKLLKCDHQERIMLMTPDGQCTLAPISTFLEFIQAGVEMRCCFAIDFTCSNGDPEDPLSLHNRTIGGTNPYEQAIHAVGTIVMDYDKSNALPAWGFGARIPPIGDTSHCFPITLEKSPNCGSVSGLLDLYRTCIRKIQLYGPTYFAPVVKTVSQMASKVKGGEQYYVLIIVTDGVITDMAKTKRAIVEASAFPMSIIIVGVGEADFSAMQELDGDAVRISANGRVAQRDIVQFVSYRSARAWLGATGECTADDLAVALEEMEDDEMEDHEPKPPEPPENDEEKTNRLAESQLAKEVLFEIPDQLKGYMKAKGITPSMLEIKKKKREDDEKEKAEEEQEA